MSCVQYSISRISVYNIIYNVSTCHVFISRISIYNIIYNVSTCHVFNIPYLELV